MLFLMSERFHCLQMHPSVTMMIVMQVARVDAVQNMVILRMVLHVVETSLLLCPSVEINHNFTIAMDVTVVSSIWQTAK
jgi:hypothetical protein